MPTDSNSASLIGSERINLRASTGVQGASGMNFGTLLWIAGNRIHLRVDSTLVPMEVVSLRVDLSPAVGTALLECTAMRVLPVAPGDPTAYLLRLDRVSPVDLPGWERFLRAKQTGGTLSDLSDVRSGSTSALRTGYAPSSSARRDSGIPGLGSAPPSSYGSTPGSGAGPGPNRLAMRDALRSAIQKTNSTSGVASQPAPVAAGALGAQRPLPLPTPRPALPGASVPDEGLSWVASNLGGRQYLEVRWHSGAAFSFDVHSQLTANALTLTSDGRALPTTPPIHAVLRFETLVVQTTATPTKQAAATVTYQLGLDEGQRATLRSRARSSSTISVVDAKPRG
jgi:hypothetical protein